MRDPNVEQLYVQCDAPGCGWRHDVDEMKDMLAWHNVPCPECGLCEIINDRERTFVQVMRFVLMLNRWINYLLPNAKAERLMIDSSQMRKGRGVLVKRESIEERQA